MVNELSQKGVSWNNPILYFYQGLLSCFVADYKVWNLLIVEGPYCALTWFASTSFGSHWQSYHLSLLYISMLVNWRKISSELNFTKIMMNKMFANFCLGLFLGMHVDFLNVCFLLALALRSTFIFLSTDSWNTYIIHQNYSLELFTNFLL